jgi:hypothetical protein
MRRWLALTAAAAAALTAAACSSSSPGRHATQPSRAAARATASASAAPAIKVAATTNWWTAKIDQAPFCGPVALLRQAGRVESLGDCAGLLLIPPASLTLTVGERIDVHIAGGFSLPRSSDPAVLAQTTVSPDGWTGTYQALSQGHVTLISARSWCVGPKIKNEVKGNCPVLAVTVLPR